MNQLLLERSLEERFKPETLKRNSVKKNFDNPSMYAKKLAEKSLKSFNIIKST